MAQLPDLPSLHNRICASPAAFHLFGRHSIDITEAILKSCVMSRNIPDKFLVAAMIRSSFPPGPSLDAFIQQVLRESMKAKVSRDEDACVPKILSKAISPCILRSLLAMTNRISCLVLTCLQSYLLHLMAIKPEHSTKTFLLEPQSCRSLEAETLRINLYSERRWTPLFPRTTTRHSSLLAHIYELQIARVQSRLNWPAEALARLQNMDPVALYDDFECLKCNQSCPDIYEIITAFRYTRDVLAASRKIITLNRPPYSLPPKEEVRGDSSFILRIVMVFPS